MKIILLQIDDELSRKSAVLACRRFRGCHTFEKIAEILDNIHSTFGINYRKITATVTDNASNFVKAFRVFNVDLPIHQEELEVDDDDNDGNSSSTEEVDVFNFTSPEVALEDEGIRLPNHIRCASHTLSLVCTVDAAKALQKSPAFSKLNHSAMGKCSALWTSAGKPKSAEVIQNHLNRQLRYPCPTRWNSLYDSVQIIVENKDKINDVMVALKLPQFKVIEIEFLEEYCISLKPISNALDRLQSENGCFYGDLIPTLLMTKQRLSQLESDARMRHCIPLLHSVTVGFKTRFQKHLSLDTAVHDAVMASLSHPFFKLRWISLVKDINELPSDQDQLVKQLQEQFVLAVKFSENEHKTSRMTSSEKNLSRSDREDNFFIFSNSPTEKLCITDGEVQALHFLQDTSNDLLSLNKYPAIKRVFLRYNTALPSSAPVERLFSFAGMIHKPKRSRLSDKLFEYLVFLKGNQQF